MQRNNRILIVDDNPTNVVLLEEILGHAYPLQTAACGEQALVMAPDYQPALILLDIMMPGIGGYETCRQFRAHPTLRHTKIVIISAGTLATERLQGYEAGADDYIMKPFDADELVAKVRVYLRLKAVEEVEQFTSKVLAAIPAILIGFDVYTAITWWNTTAEQILGLSAEQLIGKSMFASGIPWDGARILDGLVTCLATGQAVPLQDVHFQRPDGTQGFLGLTLSLISDRSSEDLRFLLIGTDITARKLLEEQLVCTQKLESLGRLAAGIAHEINTPTQYVGDNTRFLQEAFDDLSPLLEQYAGLLQASKAGLVPPALIRQVEATAAAVDVAYLTAEIPQAMQQSLEGIERITTIVRAMKEFSHPGNEDKTAIDLNKVIETTITVARNEWKYVAEMVTDLAPALPLVPCLPGELSQVVLNLIINAAHAIADVIGSSGPEKGTITLCTRHDSDWVEISIADTGTGIPTAIQDKVFDPFFTTKEVGIGTGQGLAMAYNVVVRKHGGTITFHTVAGQGTTFMMRLPLQMATA